MFDERAELHGEISSFIKACADLSCEPSASIQAKRDDLLLRVLRFQYRYNASYRAYVDSIVPEIEALHAAHMWPALPTDVFRYATVTTFDVGQSVRIFRTSGTTAKEAGKHHFIDLSLYDAAAHAAAEAFLFKDMPWPLKIVSLVPNANEAPHSSLAYMVDKFGEWFASEIVYAWREGVLHRQTWVQVLDRISKEEQPVMLVGTSFAFVMAEDVLGEKKWQLPQGSRIMQTGGFKGKAREVSKEVLLNALSARYGVPASNIVAEYGMTELSSQMYEDASQSESRILRAAPWVRLTVINAQTLLEVDENEEGLIRIDDLANLHSCCAIQTADWGLRTPRGIVLRGRAPGASLRGCSLDVEGAQLTSRA